MKTTLKIFKTVQAAVLLLAFVKLADAQTAADGPLFHWRCTAGDSSLNFNPAAYGGGNMIFDSLPYAKEYTMIVVYKPVLDTETTIWHLDYGADDNSRGFTTEHILSGNVAIRYAPETDNTPVISTIRQSAPDSVSPYARLVVGDKAKVSEILYYDKRIGHAALRRMQSALAIRYGITLGPVDWHTTDGVIWKYDSVYRHRITGLGVDTAASLCQTMSRSEMEGAMLTITADTMLCGTFLLVGDNGNALEFASINGVEVLERSWKVLAKGVDETRFTLSFDTKNSEHPCDSLVLFVDGDIYLPTTQDSVTVVFANVVFENAPDDSAGIYTGVHYLTIGRGGDLCRPVNTKGGNAAKDLDTGNYTVSIFPNPSYGRYTIEVNGTDRVQVTVYNLQGSVMATFNSKDGNSHRFEGELPTGNVYFATITAGDVCQTLKLVVK